MTHLIQAGVGSGGMPVLDMVARDKRISKVTIIEPDVYKEHNVVRHLFPRSAIGKPKAQLAKQWLLDRRPDLEVVLFECELQDESQNAAILEAAVDADIGVCAADNETAKFHWDGLMRRFAIPWTLGEVLSGGIGGFVHWFRIGGPCYGCVASHLQRTTDVDNSPAPDYSQPGGPKETTIPASIASIHTIASLHAQVTLDLLAEPQKYDPGFTSLLLPLQKVPGIFEEALRPYRFNIARSNDCLNCNTMEIANENLDQAVDDALSRLQ